MMFLMWCAWKDREPDEAALREWLNEVNQRYVAEHLEVKGRHVCTNA